MYTDGACEDFGNEVTCGGVLFLGDGSGPLYFGLKVPSSVTSGWSLDSGEQVIAQAELAPVLLSRLTFRDLLAGRHIIAFIDNDSARFGLIKGYSPNLSCARLLSAIWLEEASSQSFSWYERIPSPSNLADGPSRLRFNAMEAFPGSRRVEPVCPKDWRE